MSNPFTPKESTIPLKPKTPEPKPDYLTVKLSGVLSLPAPKPRRKQCSLYLDAEMMDRVKQIACQQGVAIGAVIEACVNAALDQMGA